LDRLYISLFVIGMLSKDSWIKLKKEGQFGLHSSRSAVHRTSLVMKQARCIVKVDFGLSGLVHQTSPVVLRTTYAERASTGLRWPGAPDHLRRTICSWRAKALGASYVISWPLGWWYPSPRLNKINSVIIPTRCIFCFGSLSRKNLQVKCAWLGAIWDGWLGAIWMGDRLGSFIGCTWVRTKCAQKTRVGLWRQYMILASCQE
jgi:hypothetical protein